VSATGDGGAPPAAVPTGADRGALRRRALARRGSTSDSNS
jgi:hypothetical protein